MNKIYTICVEMNKAPISGNVLSLTNILAIFVGIISSLSCYYYVTNKYDKVIISGQCEAPLSLSTETNSDYDNKNLKWILWMGISTSIYKLVEFSTDWYWSRKRSIRLMSSTRYYFGILVFSILVSGISLQLLNWQNNVWTICGIVLSAQIITMKAAVRICMDVLSLSWSQLLSHTVFLISYTAFEITTVQSHTLGQSNTFAWSCAIFTLICIKDVKSLVSNYIDTTKLFLKPIETILKFISKKPIGEMTVGIFLLSKITFQVTIHMMKIQLSIQSLTLFNYTWFIFLVLIFSGIPHQMLLQKFFNAIDELNAKGTYVSYTTHEIRSPLTTVVMGIDLLIDEVSNDQISLDKEGIQETLKDLRVSSEMSLSVVNDLLTLDKFQADKFSLEPSLISAWEYITSSIRPFHIQAKASHIKLVCRVQEGVDKNTTGILIDKTKAEPLIRNLVSNALKFSSKKSTVTVELSAQSTFTIRNEDSVSEKNRKKSLLVGTDGVLRISVKDHGPGISKADQLKLFGLFVQINPNQLQQGKGSGIGLWLSKKIAEVHGGIIGVESLGEGHGACFYFELPCFQLNKKITQINLSNLAATDNLNMKMIMSDVSNTTDLHFGYLSPKEGYSGTNTPPVILKSPLIPNSSIYDYSTVPPVLIELASNLGHIKSRISSSMYNILIVDDMPLIRKMVIRALEPICNILDEAGDGAEALEIMNSNVSFLYDIILLDGYMPKMTGFEAATAMRNNGFKGLIFGVTGSSSSDDREHFLRSGVNDVLQKPLDLKKLKAAIDDCKFPPFE